MENKYRITIYNEKRLDEMVTFDYPILPQPGDTIDFKILHREFFVVRTRLFSPWNEDNFIRVTLYGQMEYDEQIEESDWDYLLKKLRDRELLALNIEMSKEDKD